MMQDKIARELTSLADSELARISGMLPTDASHRFVIYMQALRQMDYWSVFQLLLPKESRLKPWDLEILWLGWNRAVEYLFLGRTEKGFPFSKVTKESNQSAISLLHNLGRSVLVKRVADMVRHRYVRAAKTKNGWNIRKIGNANDQFLDVLELSRWAKLEATMKALSDGQKFNGWTLFELSKADHIANRVGRFFGRNSSEAISALERENIRELMELLIHPWDSGFGIMMGYDAAPEVDAHFLAKAMLLVIEWRNEAGFHPKVTIDGMSVRDLTLAIAAMVSLHLKHVHFALIAMKTHPAISIPDSLTIWTPRDEIEETISGLTDLEPQIVRKLVTAMSLRAEDVSGLSRYTYPFMPLLIDLGNGLMLRPVSSISRNPFYSIRTLFERRYQNSRNHLSVPREGWLRSELYAMFQGTRYSCIAGNIKIRSHGVLVTDIDAAVFDFTTGELALFQIKWQDFSTNDVRELRSRASNLSREMDDWAERVSRWIERSSREHVAKSLRLKLRPHKQITSIFLFGISRAIARTQGFGFATQHSNLATASWSHFSRLRTQIGPSANVFADLHATLRAQMSESLAALPMPFSLKLSGIEFRFEDLWNAYDDEESEENPLPEGAATGKQGLHQGTCIR